MNEKIIAHMYTYTELIMYRERSRVNLINSDFNQSWSKIAPVTSLTQLVHWRNYPIASIVFFLFQSVSMRARRTTITSGTPSITRRRRASCWTRPASRTAARSRRYRRCKSYKTPSSVFSNNNTISSSIRAFGAWRAANSDIRVCMWSGSLYRRSCSRSRYCLSWRFWCLRRTRRCSIACAKRQKWWP